jgi:hypothetical protein
MGSSGKTIYELFTGLACLMVRQFVNGQIIENAVQSRVLGLFTTGVEYFLLPDESCLQRRFFSTTFDKLPSGKRYRNRDGIYDIYGITTYAL